MIRPAIIAAVMLTLAGPVLAQRKTEQRPDSFVDAASVAPGLIVEARYATAHNFVGRPIEGYDKPVCYLTRPAAAALAEVMKDLEPQGLTVKVFDCYRPERAVA